MVSDAGPERSEGRRIVDIMGSTAGIQAAQAYRVVEGLP